MLSTTENYFTGQQPVWDAKTPKRPVQRPKVPFDQVMDYTYIKKLGEEEKYKGQKVQTATFDFEELPVVWTHRTWGHAPDPMPGPETSVTATIKRNRQLGFPGALC